MQCLNIKNPEVAALLTEYTDILGNENAAYYVLSENNGYGLDKAPNGEPSKLFSDLLAHYNGDRSLAIQAKAKTYSKSFKEWFDGSKVVDDNGEPLIVYHGSNHNITKFEKTKLGSNTGRGEYKDPISGEVIEVDSNNAFFASSNKIVSANYAFMGNEQEIAHFRRLFEDLYTVLRHNEAYNGTVKNRNDVNEAFKEIGNKFPELKEITDKVPETGRIPKEIRDGLEMKLKEYVEILRNKTNDYSARSFTNSYSYYISSIKNFKKYLSELEKFKNNDSTVITYDGELRNISINFGKYTQYIYYNIEEKRFIYADTNKRKGYLDTLTIPQLRNLFNSMLTTARKGLAETNKNLSESGYFDNTYVGYYYVSLKNPLIHNYNGSAFPDRYVTESGKKTKYPTGYIAGRQVSKALKEGNDGVIYKNIMDPLPSDSYGFFDPNQIKSIDNRGTFSTQDNNIYHQESTVSETPLGRNVKLQELLQKLYPQIRLSEFSDPNLRGQAVVSENRAGEVLINAALENQDTLPHEYAHHYIAWFRNSEIVQRGIKLFGGEEALVQAIGENSLKAIKWYNRFFNWVKGLFNKKQKVLNKLTNSFLQGRELDSFNGNLDEVHYQKTEELPKAIISVHTKLMEALSRRIKDVQYSKAKDSRKVEELRSLEFRLNQMENDKATLEFVSYMNRDVLDALDRVTAIIAKVREAQKYGNLHDISAAELDLIKKGYIGFYGNIASNIQNMLDDEKTFEYINDPEMIQTVKDQLKKTIANYHEVVRNYNNAADIIAKENFIAEATKAGSFTVDHLRKVLDEGDTDINLWDQWLGSSQYSNSEMIRLIMNKIANAKNKVAELELERGKMLTDLLSKVSLSKLAYLHERNKDGHKTGFITRDLNYGQHYQDYVAFQRKLADKLGFGDKQLDEVASLLDLEQLKIWNEENNKWDAKHTIRKFKPEYYELTNSLSEEARSRRDEINMEINLLLSKTLDINGDAHRENLTVEEYNKLQELETKRRNLANPYYPDGTTKVDLDMKIAREMLAYNKKLREKLNYKPNMKKFNKAKADAKKNLSAEKYKLWEERNTVERITEQFWEDIKSLSSNPDKSENQLTWEEARKSLLRLYTRENGDVDINSMPANVKELINTYDEMIADEAFATRDKSKKSKVMDIAQWEINPKFYEEYKRYEKQGEAAFNAWFIYNARYDSKGNVIPASFWRKLVPKDKLKDKYVERIPNRSWAEIDRESPFYDERFTKYADRGESRIPNPKLYDNSKEYKKITSDKNLKALYDALIKTYADSNAEIGFLRYANPYKLAQIEGGAWTKIRSKDNVLKGLKTAAEDIYTVKEDDTRYMKDNAKRADGSLVKLIPTRYIKMLDDPNMLTNDIVGSTIAYYKMAMNYKVMSEAAPELELALDFVSRMKFKDRKGNEKIGENSKTYDKFKFLMDRFVYGMERDALEVDIKIPKLMDSAVTVSVDKLVSNLAAYTRIQGISQNVNVILTGLITNKIQNRLEAISGIYYGNKELAKATKVILPSYAKAIASLGTSNNKDKVLCYLEFLGLLRENEQTFSKLNQSRFVRAINQHYWYFGHEMTDYVTKGKMALAVAFFNKYNPKLGKFQNKNEFLRGFKDKKKGRAEWEALTTTFFDAFEVKNNLLVVKPEFKDIVDERTINKIRNTSKQIGTRLDTQLTDLDKAKIHSSIIGQLLLIYRNFILVNFQTKFLTKRQFNYSTGMWAEAQWPAALKYLHRHYFNTDKIAQLQELYKEEYDSLDDFEKGCLRRISFEVLFSTFGFWIISALMRAMADDDRDNWWKQEAAYLTLRSALESRGNVLPLEVINMFTTPTAAWSTLQYWGDFVKTLFQDPTEEIKKGPYKDMNRFERSLIKSTPLRSIYEAKDPRSKMEYYDNMISIF